LSPTLNEKQNPLYGQGMPCLTIVNIENSKLSKFDERQFSLCLIINKIK